MMSILAPQGGASLTHRTCTRALAVSEAPTIPSSPQKLRTVRLSHTQLALLAGGVLLRRKYRTRTARAAKRELNLLGTQFGIQDPCIALPEDIRPGAEAQRFQLSQRQIATFEEDGVLLIPGAFALWVEFLRDVVDYQVQHPHALAVSASLRGNYEYIHLNSWMTNNGIRDFFYYSPLGHILAQLGQTEELRLTTDNLLVNPVGSLGWHQDNQTGPVDTAEALRFWAPLDRCGPTDGAPEFVAGSHRNVAAVRDTTFLDLKTLGEKGEIIPFEVEPGDLLVWHARSVHRLEIPEGGRSAVRRVLSGTAVRSGANYWRRTTSGVMGDAAGHELQNGAPLEGPYFPRLYPSRIAAEELVRSRGDLVPRSPFKVFERKLQAQLETVFADVRRLFQL